MKSRNIIVVALLFVVLVGCEREEEGVVRQSGQSARDRLVAKIAEKMGVDAPGGQNGTDLRRFVEEQVANPRLGVLLSLEDFFEGNEDEGSIGCNLVPYPGLDQFYSVLKSIRAREDVQDVLVEINCIDDEFSWPFSESIWILSKASEAEVMEWMKPLQPDEIWQGWGEAGKPGAGPDPGEGVSVYGLWWD